MESLRSVAPWLAWLLALTASHASADCAAYENRQLVPPSLSPKMRAIVADYCASAGEGARKVRVTSGRRTPQQQAALMMRCLDTGSGCPSYQNQEAFREIEAAHAQNADRTHIVRTIQDQVARGCFISKHLSTFALDLSRAANDNAAGNAADCIGSLAGDDKYLAEVLEASEHVANVVYFEGGRCDHFHVNFSGFPREGFATCPE